MKRSDTMMDAQTGKYIARATPLGTVTEGMVIKRAKELAIINGRNGNDYTQDDFEQARRTPVGSFFFPEDQPRIMQEFLPSVLEKGHGEIEPVLIRSANRGTDPGVR